MSSSKTPSKSGEPKEFFTPEAKAAQRSPGAASVETGLRGPPMGRVARLPHDWGRLEFEEQRSLPATPPTGALRWEGGTPAQPKSPEGRMDPTERAWSKGQSKRDAETTDKSPEMAPRRPLLLGPKTSPRSLYRLGERKQPTRDAEAAEELSQMLRKAWSPKKQGTAEELEQFRRETRSLEERTDASRSRPLDERTEPARPLRSSGPESPRERSAAGPSSSPESSTPTAARRVGDLLRHACLWPIMIVARLLQLVAGGIARAASTRLRGAPTGGNDSESEASDLYRDDDGFDKDGDRGEDQAAPEDELSGSLRRLTAGPRRAGSHQGGLAGASEAAVAAAGDGEDASTDDDDSSSVGAIPDEPPSRERGAASGLSERELALREGELAVAKRAEERLARDEARRDRDEARRDQENARSEARDGVALRSLAVQSSLLEQRQRSISAKESEIKNGAHSKQISATAGYKFGHDADWEMGTVRGGDRPALEVGVTCGHALEYLVRMSFQAPRETPLAMGRFRTSSDDVLTFTSILTIRLAILGAAGAFGGVFCGSGLCLMPEDFAQLVTSDDHFKARELEIQKCPKNPKRTIICPHLWRIAERQKAIFFGAVVSMGYVEDLLASIEFLYQRVQTSVSVSDRLTLDTCRDTMIALYSLIRVNARKFLDGVELPSGDNLHIPAGPLDQKVLSENVAKYEMTRTSPNLEGASRDVFDRHYKLHEDRMKDLLLSCLLEKQDAKDARKHNPSWPSDSRPRHAGSMTPRARREAPAIPGVMNPGMKALADQQRGRPAGVVKIERDMGCLFAPESEGQRCCIACNTHFGGPRGRWQCDGGDREFIHGEAARFPPDAVLHDSVLLVAATMGGLATGDELVEVSDREAAISALRDKLFWTTPTPGGGPRAGGQSPISELLSPLYAETVGFSGPMQEKLRDLVGAGDVGWLDGRVRAEGTRPWDQSRDGAGSDLRRMAAEGILRSAPGAAVFGWLRERIDETKEGSVERDTADRAHAHALAFALARIPLGQDPEAVAYWLGEAFSVSARDSGLKGNRELSLRALAELYPNGLPPKPQVVRLKGHPGLSGQPPVKMRSNVFRLEHASEPNSNGYWEVKAVTAHGIWAGVDREETLIDQQGRARGRSCVINAAAAVASVREARVLEEGRAAATAMVEQVGPIGERATPFEVYLREAGHDWLSPDHGMSRLGLALFPLQCLAGLRVRILEVSGGTVTRLTVLDNPTTTVVPGTGAVLFEGPDGLLGALSNFYAKADGGFEVHGRRFTTSEHAIMYAKALHFKDTRAAKRILAAVGPEAAKKLGRCVINFRAGEWDKARTALVDHILLCKFDQCPRLREVLLATGCRRLGEASKNDNIWGTGMAANHPEARDVSKWKGNFLGQSLERVRRRIREPGLALVLRFTDKEAHCYALAPPESLRQEGGWARFEEELTDEGAIVERRTAGWKQDLAAAQSIEAPIETVSLAACETCASRGISSRRAGSTQDNTRSRQLTACARPWTPGEAWAGSVARDPRGPVRYEGVLSSLLSETPVGETALEYLERLGEETEPSAERGTGRAGRRRQLPHVVPPAQAPGSVNPDSLQIPRPTAEQSAAADAAVKGIDAADREYSSVWRAILGALFDALLWSCRGAGPAALEFATLTFRATWNRTHPRSVDPERIKLAKGLSNQDTENYRAVAAKGDHRGGGVSACSAAPANLSLNGRPSRQLKELGDVSWHGMWKRVLAGRGLFFSAVIIAACGVYLVSPPQLAVEKRDAHGLVRPDAWRICSNHQKGVNSWTSKFHFPRVFTPTSEMLTRMSLRFARLYPGCGVLGAKHDVDSAYNIVDLNASDVRLFGARLDDELGGQCWSGVALTLDFGFVGSSGAYYAVVAEGIDSWHNSHRPLFPHLNGPEAFSSLTYGDDTAICEPDLHQRYAMSDACARVGFYIHAGPTALNETKLVEDGQASSTVTAVGLTRELVCGTVSVSAARLEKARLRWSNPEYKYGNRKILLKPLQGAIGSLRHVAQVRRSMHAAYGVFNRFLVACEANSSLVARPRGTDAEVDWLYHQFWRWAEVVQLELADPEVWITGATSSAMNALSMRERLATPGFAETVFLLAGDSNEHVLCTIDPKAKRCSFVFWTTALQEEILGALSALGLPVDAQSEMMISLKEMAGPTLAADLWGPDYVGSTAVAINDNSNACSWISTRTASKAVAQHMVMALSRAESRDRADYHSAYVNTKQNVIADQGTRVLKAASAEDAARRFDEYVDWAASALPGFTVENWSLRAAELLGRASHNGSLRLLREPVAEYSDTWSAGQGRTSFTRERARPRRVEDTATVRAPQVSTRKCGARRSVRATKPVRFFTPSMGRDGDQPGDFTERAARERPAIASQSPSPTRADQDAERLAVEVEELFRAEQERGLGHGPSAVARAVAARLLDGGGPDVFDDERVGDAPTLRRRGRRRGAKETWTEETNATLDRVGLQLIDDSVCPETKERYQAHFGHWELFCERRVSGGSKRGPWLTQVNPELDEKHLIDFIAYEGLLANNGLGWATGTVRNKISAVRFFHVHNYYPDPAADSARITKAFQALERRRRDPTALKLPVTKDLLLEILRYIEARRGWCDARSDRDNATVWASIVCAWFFLLRSSEYCSIDGSMKDYCLRLGDVAFYDKDGKRLLLDDLKEAVEMSIAIRGSKTDQARKGCVRRLRATGAVLDPVGATVAALALFSASELADPETPLFALDSGRAVSNVEVNSELKGAARRLGLAPGRYDTHSLRRGGATAMAAAGIDSEVIRRWGRWLSDTWRRYVFGTSEELGHLAKDMVDADYTLSMAVEDFRSSVARE